MSKFSEKLMGSNPTEPMRPSVLGGLRRNGTDLDISALRAVDACIRTHMIFVCFSVSMRNEGRERERRE